MIAAGGAAIVLVVHVGLRAYGLFGDANARPFLVASFVLLWLAPWISLRREDRRVLGFARAPKARSIILWLAVGALCAIGVHFLFAALYGLGDQHAYVSVRATMFNGATVPSLNPWALFAIFAAPGLIFSPIGEEFFCRGVLARLGQKIWGVSFGVALSAGIFAALHIMHHGLSRTDDGAWGVMVWPGALWVSLMFIVSTVFSAARMRAGTIWAAVVCHAGFNVAMTAIVFLVFGTPF